MGRRGRWIGLIAVVVAVGVLAGVVLLFGGGGEPVAPDPEPTPPGDVGAASPDAPISPEEQAKSDLERLVVEYYAAENAVYLDPSKDPSAALDPYLRNPASGARVADIMSFRNAKHRLDSSSTEVHSVLVTSMDLDAVPATATVDECHTLAASGIDGETGEPASFSNRRRTVWTAIAIGDGSWRLKTYETGAVGSC